MTVRIKTFFSALLILSTVLLGLYKPLFSTAKTDNVCPETSGWSKTDWTDLQKEQSFDTGTGNIIDQVCVKGGDILENFSADGTKSCWQVSGINTQIGIAKETWLGDDKGSDCKDISYVSFHIISAMPTNTPTPTPTITNTPTNTPTGTLSPTPTQTQTPTETPTPTNTPVPTATPTNSSNNNDNNNDNHDNNNDNNVGGDNSPAPTSVVAQSIIQSSPTVLGTADTTNYLIDSIKDAYGGQILGVNSLPATASDNIFTNLPSSNQLIDNHFISIPSLSILEPVYQSQTLGDQLLVGDNQILLTQINGANVYYGHNQYGLFSNLYQLQKGKSIFIDNGSQLQQFTITSKANVNFSDLSIFDNATSTDIFLVTCSRTYPDTRIVIKAHLL